MNSKSEFLLPSDNILFSASVSFTVWNPQITEIMQYLSFCDWIMLFSETYWFIMNVFVYLDICKVYSKYKKMGKKLNKQKITNTDDIKDNRVF